MSQFRRFLATVLVLFAVFAAISSKGTAADAANTIFALTVRYPDGTPVSGLPVALYVGDVPKPAVTDVNGVKRWWLSPSQDATRISLTGWVESVTSTGEVDAWPDGGYVHVCWQAGAANVMIGVVLSDAMPTATPTRTPTGTPWPTATPGPSSTPRATLVPDYSVPHVVIEAEPDVIPGRFTYTWWRNLCEVTVFSADGGSFGQFGPGPHTYEGSGWTRWHVVADPQLYPPTVIEVEVTRVVTVPCPTAVPTLTIGEAQRDVLRRIWRGVFP